MKDYSDKKVLIIDDERLNIKITERFLKNYYNVDAEEGYSAKDLFEKIKETKYDLIILDDMMPEMYGSEAVKLLRNQGYSKNDLVIVALTANIQHRPPREHFMNIGFNEYLAKPLKRNELDRVLNLFLN